MTGLYDLADDWREEDDEEQDPADEDYWEPEPENADPDGDPDEDYWGAEEHWKHRDEAHGGGECNCPRPDWPEPEPGVVYSDEPPF